MPDNYFARYLPILIHILLAGAIAGAIVTLSWLIGQRKPTRAKLAPYECGMTPVGDSRAALLCEILPGRHVVHSLRCRGCLSLSLGSDFARPEGGGPRRFGLAEMMIYIAIVLVGFFYIWKKGALEWGQSERRRS